MVNDEMLDKDLKNKGYCFVEFGDHKSAATAKKKLENTRDLVSMENDLSCILRKPVFGVTELDRHKLGCTQTGDGKRLGIMDLGSKRDCTIYLAKTKALISCMVMQKQVFS